MSRTVKEKEQQQTISLSDFETLQKTRISPCWQADRSGPLRPWMTSPLRKLLADRFKTFTGQPEDWTASGPCHLNYPYLCHWR